MHGFGVCESGWGPGEARGPWWLSFSVTLCALLLETGLSLNLEPMDSAGLAGHVAPKILRSLLLQGWAEVWRMSSKIPVPALVFLFQRLSQAS